DYFTEGIWMCCSLVITRNQERHTNQIVLGQHDLISNRQIAPHRIFWTCLLVGLRSHILPELRHLLHHNTASNLIKFLKIFVCDSGYLWILSINLVDQLLVIL